MNVAASVVQQVCAQVEQETTRGAASHPKAIAVGDVPTGRGWADRAPYGGKRILIDFESLKEYASNLPTKRQTDEAS